MFSRHQLFDMTTDLSHIPKPGSTDVVRLVGLSASIRRKASVTGGRIAGLVSTCRSGHVFEALSCELGVAGVD